MRPLWILALAVLLTACGASKDTNGGSAAGDGAAADGDSGTEGSYLGARELPGAQVSAWRLDPLLAGTEARFRLQIAGASEPTGVEVLLGSDYQQALPSTVSSEGAGSWLATVLLPDPLPVDAAILVRLSFADGSTEESGTHDFTL